MQRLHTASSRQKNGMGRAKSLVSADLFRDNKARARYWARGQYNKVLGEYSMRKVITSVAAIALAVGLAACSEKAEDATGEAVDAVADDAALAADEAVAAADDAMDAAVEATDAAADAATDSLDAIADEAAVTAE